MPQASDERRAQMEKLFGDPTDDRGPMDYLTKAGYQLTHKWSWIPKPGVTNYDQMTEDEFNCLAFLIEEWDMAGLELPR